jgi:hypothetical protein
MFSCLKNSFGLMATRPCPMYTRRPTWFLMRLPRLVAWSRSTVTPISSPTLMPASAAMTPAAKQSEPRRSASPQIRSTIISGSSGFSSSSGSRLGTGATQGMMMTSPSVGWMMGTRGARPEDCTRPALNGSSATVSFCITSSRVVLVRFTRSVLCFTGLEIASRMAASLSAP